MNRHTGISLLFLFLAALSGLGIGKPAFAADDGALQYIYHDTTLPSPTPVFDEFGGATAVSGSHLAVGEPGSCPVSVSGYYCGSVYLFNRVNGQWVQEARLTSPTPQANAYYGSAVAISGDWLFVGAYGYNTVYLYQRQQSGSTVNWVPVPLDTSTLPSGELGFSVAISSAGFAVAGMPYRSASGESIDGAVATFTRNSSTGVWSVEALLEGTDAFGSSVSIYVNRLGTLVTGYELAVGSPNYLDERGAGDVFTRAPSDTSWTHRASYSLGTSGNANELFGSSVSIYSSAIAFGVPYRHVTGNIRTGSVYMVHKNSGDWTDYMGAEVDSPDATADLQTFGASVALHDNTLFVGAPRQLSVYQYDYVHGSLDYYWAENSDSPLRAPDSAPYGNFGASATSDGTSAVFGSTPYGTVDSQNGSVSTFISDGIFTDGFEPSPIFP